MTNDASDILPDLLTPNLKVVFCGTAAGNTSAQKREYYAYRRNRFWKILHECNLTDRRLQASDFAQLAQYGVGLTDLCKNAYGNDDELPTGALSPTRLLAAITLYKPRFLAFTSRNAGRAVCGPAARYGRQELIHQGTAIYILPTTSSRRGDKWWSEQKKYWHEFADAVRAT